MESRAESIAGMKIIRLIGEGGMSEVYEVEDPRLGVRHAVKVYSCPNDIPQIRSRFETEGRLLAKLSHPRIVRVSDYGVDPDSGNPYFVMDLVLNPDGVVQSLADVPAGTVDEGMVGKWYDDIREGLTYVHGKGVIHRDLKLQNILIGPDGRAVITDFGISRIFDPDGGNEAIVDPVQTIVNMQDGKSPVMGSVGYMAPELEMGVAATAKSDWYALGVIAYRLLTGTWCDARTNISDVLQTYDPVWMKLLPGLLHSNPEGRVCLSYADEREKILARENDMLEESVSRLREEIEREKENGAALAGSLRKRFAVRMKLCCAALLSVLTLAFASTFVLWRQKAASEAELDVPCFDSLFSIPHSASEEETDSMPAHEDFRCAMLDALALTHSMFLDLKNGLITRDKVRELLLNLLDEAKRDDIDFSGRLPFAFQPSCSEPKAMEILLKNAVERLK